MHQLDGVPGRDRRLPERRAAHDAAVVLDDDRAGVERELRDQLEQCDAGPYGPGRSVHDDFHNASSICLAAAAGSVASHRARIAAAPCAPASRTSRALRAVTPPIAITGRPPPSATISRSVSGPSGARPGCVAVGNTGPTRR